MKSKQPKLKILPCPWCGEVPSIDKARSWTGSAAIMWEIRCVSKKCDLAPHHIFCMPKEEAIKMWNTRKEIK